MRKTILVHELKRHLLELDEAGRPVTVHPVIIGGPSLLAPMQNVDE